MPTCFFGVFYNTFIHIAKDTCASDIPTCNLKIKNKINTQITIIIQETEKMQVTLTHKSVTDI